MQSDRGTANTRTSWSFPVVAVKSRVHLHILAEALVEGACFHHGSEIGYLLRVNEELHLGTTKVNDAIHECNSIDLTACCIVGVTTLEKDLQSRRMSGMGSNAGGGTERNHGGKIERSLGYRTM